MSGFLKGLTQASASAQPAQALDETSRAIFDIENKKKAISQASLNDQNAIKSKISDAYRKIGETSYFLYTEDSLELEKITGMFDDVKSLHQILDEKQAKLDEILKRYDEELEILRPAPAAGQEACPSCGTVYVVGEAVFCSGCGNKVPDIPVASETMSPQQSLCLNCNAAIIPGSVFCGGCGNKF